MSRAEEFVVTLSRPQLSATLSDGLPIPGPPGPQGPPGPAGPAGVTQPFRLGHTWGLVGDVTVITTLPSLFIPLRAGQASALAAVRAKLGSGTSINVQVKRNGLDVGSPITVTPAAWTTSLGNVALADGDEVTVVLSSPIGNPSDLGITLILEHTPS
jgi:hypothetical protein